jgi:hypothetical protein
MKLRIHIILFMFLILSMKGNAQKSNVAKDSIVYHFIHRDTVIYRYDTIRVKYYVRTDTIWNDGPKKISDKPHQKRLLNPNAWGIGPTAGAYYSPINGFDVNIGFGIQYYLFAVPSFRNPHMKVKRQHQGR